MFSKLSLLALATPFLLLVDALTLVTPSNVISGQQLTLPWDVVSGDSPSFSLWLRHPSFRQDFGIANNVGTSNLQITFVVPDVLAQDDYTFRATPINDVTTTFSETNPFAISTISTTVTQSSHPSTSSTTSKSSTSTTSNSTTGVNTTPTQSTTNSGFGSTVADTSSSTQTSAQESGSPTETPSSALSAVKFSFFNGAGVGAFVLSVVAGASLFTF